MALKLHFGCYATNPWASPKNWKTISESTGLKKEWYVMCKFFDPEFAEKYPNGFQYKKKLNRLNSIRERREAVAFLLEEMKQVLQNGYNPITKKFMLPQEETEVVLSSRTSTADAVEKAWQMILDDDQLQKSNVKKPFNEVRIAKNRFIKGLKVLRLDSVPIGEISQMQIKETLRHLQLPNASYNKFLYYMAKIWTELFECGVVETNPFKLYKKKKTIKTIREVFEDDGKFEALKEYLKTHHYFLYRYTMIFHMSGARSTELMGLRRCDVDLENQEYTVLIKKGIRYEETKKVIIKSALPYWKELISECKTETDYLFSYEFRPGQTKIAARRVTNKWSKFVKKRIAYNNGKIEMIDKTKKQDLFTEDFYSLKHLFLDRLDAELGDGLNNVSQKMASHKSPTITNKAYLVGRKKRELEKLKKITL